MLASEQGDKPALVEVKRRHRLSLAEIRQVLSSKEKEGDLGAYVELNDIVFGNHPADEALDRHAFCEETGLEAEVVDLLHVSEVILPERPYHSVSIAFSGTVTGGMLRAEADHPYGTKVPRWFPATEVRAVKYHPERVVEKALGLSRV